MSFNVFFENALNKFNRVFRPAPSITSVLPKDMIKHIFSFLNNTDVGNFEQASRNLYAIASNPLNRIHTPFRLTCRDLSLNLTAQIEKVREAVVNRPLTQQEMREGGLTRTGFSYSAEQAYHMELSANSSTCLNQLFNSFKQYLVQLNAEGKKEELSINFLAMTKLIEGSIKSTKVDFKKFLAMTKLIEGSIKSTKVDFKDLTQAKANTTVQDFHVKVFDDLINSYANQSPETIDPDSFKERVDLIKELFNNIDRRNIESELKYALIQNGRLLGN